MKARYPESALQGACTQWMVSDLGFTEVHEDAAAVGSRFDSVGLLNGRLTLIEYKVSITAMMVDHASDRSMSIESKIAGGLRSVYNRETGHLAQASNAVWDRSCPPIVGTIASSYSTESLHRLSLMLERRSREWLFSYVVWRWSGSALDVLIEGDLTHLPEASDYANVVVPELIGRTPRPANRSIDELRAIAEQRGIASLSEAFLQSAKESGLTLRGYRHNIIAGRRSEGKWRACIAIYLAASDPVNGANIGLDLAAVDLESSKLPGKPAPPAGYLNTNRFADTPDCVSQLVQLFSPLRVRVS